MVTFSNLLNVIDGVLYKHGCILFLTTNHPEKLDHTLLRIGRIDSVHELNYPHKNQIKNFYKDIIKENENISFEMFYNYIKNAKIPMSSIVNFLFKYKTDWNTHINELLDTHIYIDKCLDMINKHLLFT